MAGLNMRCLVFAFAMAMILLLSRPGAHGEDICGGDLEKLYLPCMDFINKPGPQNEPSKDCCDAFNQVDLSCCCKNIPSDFEDVVSMVKFTYVAKKCDRPLESGSKCGSYTVPMA